MSSRLLDALLLTLHVLAAAAWVGGMACMHFAVRPAAMVLLQPPQRIPFLTAALGRFFIGVAVAIGVILLSGTLMVMHRGGLIELHWSTHAMLATGLVMTAIFGHIRFAIYPRTSKAVTIADWKAAAAQLDKMRRLLALNLGLGTLTFVVALAGRAL